MLISVLENDIHYAALTVKQTLEFALKAKTPKNLPSNLPKPVYRQNFLTALLKIFGIEHTVNTRVGNEVPLLIQSSLTCIVHPWCVRRREKTSFNCRNIGR